MQSHKLRLKHSYLQNKLSRKFLKQCHQLFLLGISLHKLLNLETYFLHTKYNLIHLYRSSNLLNNLNNFLKLNKVCYLQDHILYIYLVIVSTRYKQQEFQSYMLEFDIFHQQFLNRRVKRSQWQGLFNIQLEYIRYIEQQLVLSILYIYLILQGSQLRSNCFCQ